MSETPRARIAQYYATVPLLFADSEDFGSLRLFVPRVPGAVYYGGPSHAQPTADDLDRVRARQRDLGVPEAFEWLAEAAPALRATVEAAGLPVAERPLMTLDPPGVSPRRHHPADRQPAGPVVAQGTRGPHRSAARTGSSLPAPGRSEAVGLSGRPGARARRFMPDGR
ncbi:hypothetical protein ACWD25_56420 [Streptomyces sp. NPDC002920]